MNRVIFDIERIDDRIQNGRPQRYYIKITYINNDNTKTEEQTTMSRCDYDKQKTRLNELRVGWQAQFGRPITTYEEFQSAIPKYDAWKLRQVNYFL